MSDDARPDTFTNEWWKKQWEEVQKGYRGVTHIINCCHADYKDCYESIKALREQSATQAKALEEAQAEIGRLLGEVEAMKETLAEARIVWRKLNDEKERKP